jgi:3-oxoacyl-(acyl-carrier-protein) synthase
MRRQQWRDQRHRVVVTGLGAVTVIGDTPEAFHNALVNGQSGITRWKKPRDDRHYSRIGGDLSDFDLAAHLERQGGLYAAAQVKLCLSLMRSAPLVPRLVAAAALQAWNDAALPSTMAPERIGHILGGHNLNAGYIVENSLTFHHDEPDYIEPLFGLLSLDTDVLSATSELLSLKGPSFTVGGACASSNIALCTAVDMLRAGRADAMLVTGAPIELEPVVLHSWGILDAISIRSFNDTPERASRPFDALREGFVPSEGAGALVLETLASARARQTRIHGEVLGTSSTSDGSRLTRPDQGGQTRAIRLCLDDARISPEQVDYVNAHATSTPLGDAVEVAAIKAALGSGAGRIPVNSTKSMIGHCLSAASILEMVATLLQMRDGVVHPTINQEQGDPALDLDFVPNEARQADIDIALSNAFGFGGINSCVVVGRVEE